MTFPPGKAHYYSNYSFGVADRVMENVSGLSLEDFTQASVFGPLGMINSSSQYWPNKSTHYARLYDQNGEETGPYHIIPLGGAGYFSSIHDMLHYGQFYAKHPFQDQTPILSHKTIDQMFTLI